MGVVMGWRRPGGLGIFFSLRCQVVVWFGDCYNNDDTTDTI